NNAFKPPHGRSSLSCGRFHHAGRPNSSLRRTDHSRREATEMKNYIALGALLVLLWSAPLRAQSYSYEAEHRADGTIAITVIGTRSLRSGPDNFSMPLADKLEEAAATEG